MKCEKCNQELKNNALFCGSCGARTSVKLAKLLRATGIVNVIIIGISLITGLPMIGENIELTGLPYTIWGFIANIFFLYVTFLVIKNAKNYEKAGHLKKMSIVYLVLVIASSIIAILMSQEIMQDTSIAKGLLGFGAFIGIMFTCLFPTLYIIFSSNIEKMYLKSKED